MLFNAGWILGITAKLVIGRIGADKLAELEKLTAVIYVAPMT